MFLKMIIKGKEADKVSYMIGKNPENVYISNERVISEISEQDLVGLKFINDNEIFLKESSFGDKIKNLLLKDKVIDKDGNVLRGKKCAYIVKDNILVRRKNKSRAETYLVFQNYDSEEVEFSLFTIADSNKLGEGFQGYVNEREFLAGSLFSLEIFDYIEFAHP